MMSGNSPMPPLRDERTPPPNDILTAEVECDVEQRNAWWGASRHYLLLRVNTLSGHLLLRSNSCGRTAEISQQEGQVSVWVKGWVEAKTLHEKTHGLPLLHPLLRCLSASEMTRYRAANAAQRSAQLAAFPSRTHARHPSIYLDYI